NEPIGAIVFLLEKTAFVIWQSFSTVLGYVIRRRRMNLPKPQTRFTRSGDVAIAYQVVGDGPQNLIYASGWLSNIDVIWENPGYNEFLSRLAESCRLILFDKRGTGMSDRDVGVPTLEERSEDIRAVLDAVKADQASIFGMSEGGSMALMFAASYPERVNSIVLFGCRPCRAWKPDWPSGQRRAEFEKGIEDEVDNWGDFSNFFEIIAPSVADDPDELAFFNRLIVQSGSPKTADRLTRLNYEHDVRVLLPTIQAPTRVIHADGDRSVDIVEAKYLADHLPNAEYLEIQREDHIPWVGDTHQVADLIVDFVSKPDKPRLDDRVLLSILVTDIVGSTQQAAKLGDANWREIIEQHDSAALRALARCDGKLIKSLGDGIMASFRGPSNALAAAAEIRAEAEKIGLKIRAGIHTGECLKRGNDLTGLAVNISARIADIAEENEVRVSGTVRDLVVGSGREFSPLGTVMLKGIPEEWPLYKLVS
ncbi:adenylate/guanylate cyclase domain-containing protein, partial [Marimonas sp. MJW-29]